MLSWQPMADLCFADLLLFVPEKEAAGRRFVVLAQVRPATGQTLYPHDTTGTIVDERDRPLMAKAFRTGKIVEGDAVVIGSEEPTQLLCVPVSHDDRIIAVLACYMPTVTPRRRGDLERNYLEAFDRFAGMVAEGSFPFGLEELNVEEEPQVSDGVIIVDQELTVSYASPNSVSAMHRMGIHAYAKGVHLRDLGLDEGAVRAALTARVPVLEEVEQGESSTIMRVIPFLEEGEPAGVIILIRDVTDLRRRDRMLLTKDATIREIHHRVKNNLQTIAALLRLQRRRLRTPEAQKAVSESERRIRSIAIVHETLSQDSTEVVPFDEIIRPLVRVVEEGIASPDVPISFRVEGSAGDLPGAVATPIAVVLNELMQNALDHAFDYEAFPPEEGNVRIVFAREGTDLIIDVVDDGRGLPDDFDIDVSKALGLSIVEALVTGELGGSIELCNDNGTRVHIRVPIAEPALADA